MQTFPFSDLSKVDLIVDATYQSGRSGNAGDDPFPRLLGLSNMGGFRYRGTLGRLDVVALISSMGDPDWPDFLDRETGVFTYYGDNKMPGGDLHATSRQGNKLLREIFALMHAGHRCEVPPIFVFTKGPAGRDVIFRGLAVPGAPGVSQTEDLVAVWKTKEGHRFQNYRAIFTILNESRVTRSWLQRIQRQQDLAVEAPRAWAE